MPNQDVSPGEASEWALLSSIMVPVVTGILTLIVAMTVADALNGGWLFVGKLCSHSYL